MTLWQPSASIDDLKHRSKIIQYLRQFFYQRGVLEIETPLLASTGVTDLYLDNMTSQFIGPEHASGKICYLQTSPEYAMKRLLAAGSSCIFQICKAFRNDELGRYHNPEFTMLEWYRVGYNHHDLMQELNTLLQGVLSCETADKYTYQNIFIKLLNIDPLCSNKNELSLFLDAHNYGDIASQLDSYDDLLQFIFSQFIEPQIGLERPCFVYNFPANQASLAKINTEDPRTAARFEAYYKGIELANGFYELSDANEQEKRFKKDNQLRQAQGLASKPIDNKLIAALEHGLPDCAGVAVGIDRLIMLALNKTHISEVLSFDIKRS